MVGADVVQAARQTPVDAVGTQDAESQLRVRRAYHEVKSPAALIVTVARAALEQDDPARARAALELIERIAERTLERVGSVFNAPMPVPARTPAQFLEGLVSDALRCDLQVSLVVGERASECRVRRDPAAFEALSQALMENAHLHGDPAFPIEVGLSRLPEGLELRVSNRRASEVRHVGQRIGLRLAEDLAARMGGSLRVSSRAAEFVVRVTVPVA